MSETKKTLADDPRILAVGSDQAALDLIQAQIELRGLQGCVEVACTLGQPGGQPDLSDFDLVICHGSPSALLPDAGSVDASAGDADLKYAQIFIDRDGIGAPDDAHHILPATYHVSDLIAAVGQIVDFPWPAEILGEMSAERQTPDIETRYRDLFNRASDAVLLIEQKTHIIVAANEQAERMYSYGPAELVGQYLLAIADSSDHVAIYRNAASFEKGGRPKGATARRMHLKKDGTPMTVTVSGALLAYGEYNVFQDILRDETDRISREEELERLVEERTRDLMLEQERLRQAQKMESIGQLTGGIAHDFNNLLTVILGNQELLEKSLPEASEQMRLLRGANAAAQRGAQVISQLLSFSRHQRLQPQPLKLGEAVSEIRNMLDLTLGKTIHLEVRAESEISPVFVDRAQLQNVILNLALNARDAMPKGGDLVIEIDRQCSADHANGQDAGDCPFVRLAFTDTGIGMSPEVQERAVEPFFTTKEEGKGTGLGLSMMHGFVIQSGGIVEIDSAEGRGTKISLYLPVARNAAGAGEQHKDAGPVPATANETVLVVEDDTSVQRVTMSRLRGLGYHPIAVETANAALDVLSQEGRVHLVLTDYKMPGGLSGLDLAERVESDYPEAKVIISSGYANDRHLTGGRFAWLQKPYNLRELSEMLRRALNE